MKPTDLNFKVLTPTPERAQKLLEALTRANIRYSTHLKPEAALAMSLCRGHFSFWRSSVVSAFDKEPMPEVTFAHALKLLAQVEAPTPTFDIKLRDEVLCRHNPIFEWDFKIFTRVTEDYFSTTGHVYEQLIPYKGNEHLHGKTTTPDGWWEVESGQPVWRRK
jgi:hypothetical protein